MSLELFINDFLEYLEIEKGCSPLTIKKYRQNLVYFNKWLLSNGYTAEPTEIATEQIRKYRLHLAHFSEINRKPLKRITQNYYVIALRSFFKYLLVKRDINIISPDKIELPKQPARTVNFLNMEQINRLLNSPKINNEIGLRDRSILEMLFSTGVRVSELVSLNRDQIDIKRREFSIKGKGNKYRIVFLSDSAAEWLSRYLKIRKDSYKPIFIRYGGKPELSDKKDDKLRLTARSIQNIVKKYTRNSGITIKVTPHTLRHSFATDLLIQGADIRSVQEMLGHESIRTTQVYTHITDKHLKEVHKLYHSKI